MVVGVVAVVVDKLRCVGDHDSDEGIVQRGKQQMKEKSKRTWLDSTPCRTKSRHALSCCGFGMERNQRMCTGEKFDRAHTHGMSLKFTSLSCAVVRIRDIMARRGIEMQEDDNGGVVL